MIISPAPLHAFVDESGVRARTKASSQHFVMTAVVIADEALPASAALLAQLRQDLNRRPGDMLHWKNFKTHAQRLHAAKTVGAQEWITLSSVVVCKPYLTGEALNDDMAYLYTLKFLLERLSWLAQGQNRVLHYTLAHIVRFQIAKLREYEAKLRKRTDCSIVWGHLDARGGGIDQPNRLEQLQLADIAASATALAFEPDEYGNTERRYLQELAPRLYRGPEPNSCLTSYGMKLHPKQTRAAYPWVAAL